MNERMKLLEKRFKRNFPFLYGSDDFSLSLDVWEFMEDAIQDEHNATLRESRRVLKSLSLIKKLKVLLVSVDN